MSRAPFPAGVPMPVIISAPSVRATDFSGVTDVTPDEVKEIEFDATSTSAQIFNDSEVDDLMVSMDGQYSWITLHPAQEINGPLSRASIHVKSAEGSEVPYTCIASFATEAGIEGGGEEPGDIPAEPS